MTRLYDEIGGGYRRYRRPDRRIAAAIGRALEGAEPVLNVGAGTGSYEPAEGAVVAVEPSMAMIRPRQAGSAPIVRASATSLPFRDAAFAAALAVLTVHHWPDRAHGLADLARVARDRVVIVTWDPASPEACSGSAKGPADSELPRWTAARRRRPVPRASRSPPTGRGP
jgi:SAM-dependent methyltransferase